MSSTTLSPNNSRICTMFGKHNYILRQRIFEISNKYMEKKYLLDIGCGDGSKTLIFDSYERELTGVDCLDWRNEQAKKRITFFIADFMWGFPLINSDIIFSFDVIEHLPEPEKLLQFAKKALNKDGVLVVGTPNRVRAGTLGLRKFPYNPDNHTDKYASHLREYSVGELTKLIEDNGFKVIKTHKLFYGITGSYGFSEFFGLPLFHHIILEAVHAD